VILRISWLLLIAAIALFTGPANWLSWFERAILAGAALAAFLAFDRVLLPRLPFFRLLTFLITLVLLTAFVALGAWVFDFQFKMRHPAPAVNLGLMIASLLALYTALHYARTAAFFKPQTAEAADAKEAYLVDTSALIDGRVGEVCKAGFLSRSLVVPEFVMKELQLIADSTVHEKRKKGRRGLSILGEMKASDQLDVQILPGDVENLRGVDNKLLFLAKKNKATIISTDFNLQKVAQVEGVQVININNLATLLKPNYAVGDTIKVSLVKKGNARRQAIGYLEDDTMVVVEEGERLLGTTQDMVVTSYLQSETGKIVFCRLA
jgi:uncharacterized protein YacL